MEREILVMEGKNFVVDMQSLQGSVRYGWFLSRLPEGLILLGSDLIPGMEGLVGAPAIQRFYFGFTAKKEDRDNLEFKLTSPANPQDVKDTYTVWVKIIPYNSNGFVPHQANAAESYAPSAEYGCPDGVQAEMGANQPFINAAAPDLVLKYGYPCGVQTGMAANQPFINTPALKYGYPCGVQEGRGANQPFINAAADDAAHPALKYGYPCGVQEGMGANQPFINTPALKYGYPCGVQEGRGANQPFINAGQPFINAGQPFINAGQPFINAGQPFINAAADDAAPPALKYGYPCGVQEGMGANQPFINTPALKYGYPCGVQEGMGANQPFINTPALKYGYPCGIREASKATTPYGVWSDLR